VHQSPLRQFHVDHGARLVDFAGWEMPIMYSGVIDEHKQTRASGGIFDVSHMGRVKIAGRHAKRLLERLCSRKIGDMQQGQCRYSLVCNERGGIRDDVIVMRLDEDEFIVVVNAANREKLLSHFESIRTRGELAAKIDDQTMNTAMVAMQGPRVMEFIGNFSNEIPSLKRYRFATKNLVVMKLYVSRTGYTGEDGVEVILPSMSIGMAMKLLLKDMDLSSPEAMFKPAGLGARDTLRLEAGMPLYGAELGEEVNALSTGLDFAISLDKDEEERGEAFIGMEALKRTRAEGGTPRKLTGILLDGKRSPRAHMVVKSGDREVGEVTSGCLSPTLERPIAMAYVDRELAEPGTALLIDTGRGAMLEGEATSLPFYKARR